MPDLLRAVFISEHKHVEVMDGNNDWFGCTDVTFKRDVVQDLGDEGFIVVSDWREHRIGGIDILVSTVRISEDADKAPGTADLTPMALKRNDRQPRERAVPCTACFIDTWNRSALCDRHEEIAAVLIAMRSVIFSS